MSKKRIAYHGSGKVFDHFDSNHIGSGQDVQKYGRGFYFASSPRLAEFYRQDVAQVIPDSDHTLVRDGEALADDDPLVIELNQLKSDIDAFNAMMHECSAEGFKTSSGALYRVAISGSVDLLNSQHGHLIIDYIRIIELLYGETVYEDVYNEAYEAACEHSMSFDDEAFGDLILHMFLCERNAELAERCQDMAPDYDWDAAFACADERPLALDMYEMDKTLYSSLVHFFGDEEDAQRFLYRNFQIAGIESPVGGVSHYQPESDEVQYVIFPCAAEAIKIETVCRHDFDGFVERYAEPAIKYESDYAF